MRAEGARRSSLAWALAVLTAACATDPMAEDADTAQHDAGRDRDATGPGSSERDAGGRDAGGRDAASDAASDASVDAGVDDEFSCAARAAAHPEWLLCDDFEQGDGDFDAWLAATPFHEFDGEDDRGRLTLASDHVRSGRHALHMPAAESSGYRGASVDWLQCDGEYRRGCGLGGHDELYFRAWVRFDAEHEFVHHFLNIGGRYTAASPYNDTQSGYWFNGTAGCLPDGTTHMGMTLEVDRARESPRHHTGYFYTYHPEMAPSNCGGSGNPRFPEICADCNRWEHIGLQPTCDNPDRRCYWGDTIKVSDDALAADPARYTFPKGEWFCLEVRMRANTPGAADGEMEYWIDDAPAQRVEGMRWRSVDTLALNKVRLQHYITGNTWFGTRERSNQVWFDDVVISTARIGCH